MTLPANLTLAALRVRDPAAFRARVREVLKRSRNLTDAAKALRVDRTTLWRWTEADPALLVGVTVGGPGRPLGARNRPRTPRVAPSRRT